MFVKYLPRITFIIAASFYCAQANVPVRIPALSQKDCPAFPLNGIKKNITDIIDIHYPRNSCNCSQLIDSTSNVSCITACCGEGRLIFDTNLNVGSSYLAQRSGLTWLSSLYDPPSSQTCDRQGVLRINFQEACNFTNNCKLRFDFTLLPSHTGWNLNIGDSSNDGYGGDAGHTSNSAEVHNVGPHFLVLANTLPGYASATINGIHTIDSISHVVGEHFTVVIGDEFVMFDNNNGVQRSYRSRYLFTLNGQPTTYGPVDYLINLGMNRVIRHNGRSGTGLCRVTIRTLSC